MIFGGIKSLEAQHEVLADANQTLHGANRESKLMLGLQGLCSQSTIMYPRLYNRGNIANACMLAGTRVLSHMSILCADCSRDVPPALLTYMPVCVPLPFCVLRLEVRPGPTLLRALLDHLTEEWMLYDYDELTQVAYNACMLQLELPNTLLADITSRAKTLHDAGLAAEEDIPILEESLQRLSARKAGAA